MGCKGLLSLTIILALLTGTVLGTLCYAAMKSDIKSLDKKNELLSRKVSELQQKHSSSEELQIYPIRAIHSPGNLNQQFGFYPH